MRKAFPNIFQVFRGLPAIRRVLPGDALRDYLVDEGKDIINERLTRTGDRTAEDHEEQQHGAVQRAVNLLECLRNSPETSGGLGSQVRHQA